MRLTQKIKKYFGPNKTIHVASAPGRLDVMGGIADYSGSHVLQMPIKERTTVYVSLRDDGMLRAHTSDPSLTDNQNFVQIPIPTISTSKKSDPFDDAHKALNQNKETTWVNYIFGCALALNIEYNANIQGADFWVESNVPLGKGVSSSAALEVATLSALCSALDLHLTGNQLPILAQKVENKIVGAPCGLMDQLATYFGKKGQLLPILCQPDVVHSPISIPHGVYFIGVDSGQRHSVGGSSYTDVRTAAFMGYTIIAKYYGITKKQLLEAKRSGSRDKLPFNGYLANVKPGLFEGELISLLPDGITGAEFKEQYDSTIDPITTPDPETHYAVKTCTAHPVYENHNIKIFEKLLSLLNSKNIKPKEQYKNLGELMYQSHESYNQCGLGSEATDALVNRARQASPEHGVYGAKITGGGSGGTVCFLCQGKQGLNKVKEIAERHAQEFQCDLTLFTGSSDGAYWKEVEQFYIDST